MGQNKTYIFSLKNDLRGLKRIKDVEKPNNAVSELHQRIKVGNKTKARE